MIDIYLRTDTPATRDAFSIVNASVVLVEVFDYDVREYFAG